MTKEQLKEIGEKISNNTATAEEKILFYQTLGTVTDQMNTLLDNVLNNKKDEGK